MLAASGRIECQEVGGTEPPAVDTAEGSCRSVVCLQPQPPPPLPDSTDSRQATREKLDARRLRHLEAQAGMNTVEVIGERPSGAESDPWQDFRQSVGGAAVPECFSPNASADQPLPATGLLGVPLLLHAAAVGKCR